MLRTILAAVVMLLFCAQALAASISCYINANTKIYNYPSTKALSMNVPKNMTCEMVAFNGSWALVSRSGANAFIPLKYLTLVNRIPGYTAASTPLYREASTSSHKLGTIPAGMPLYVVGRDGNFFRITDVSGKITGYVSPSKLTNTPPKTAPANKPSAPVQSGNSLMSTTTKYSSGMSNAEKLEYVIYVAQVLYGRPYSANANPPESFDCSRFVKFCFQQAHVDLTSSSKSQGYDGGYSVISNASELRRGDVVCFNTDSSDDDLSDHTGIYLGDGYFVHASSGAGKVIVSSLASGYYKDTFSWGRRILN